MLKHIAVAAALALPAAAQTGPARVIDGDTIDVAGTRIRLWGIDAPESRQTCERGGVDYACGREATAHLRVLLADVEVACEARVKDRYGRTVALCRAGPIDVGAAMVRDGWALAFVRYSADYVVQEQEAQRTRRGMWAGSFMPPWEWRQAQRVR
jgi:endonuclease YncB( thermonuclease family)